MSSLDDLESRISKIEERDRRVELDKVWETSWSRRILLVLFTYLVISFYLQAIEVQRPWLNAIVPSIGFILSTLTLSFFKELWLRYINNKNK